MCHPYKTGRHRCRSLHIVYSSIMSVRGNLSVVFLALCGVLACSASFFDEDVAGVVNKVVADCSTHKTKYSCMADKASMALERAMDWDVPLFDGLKFVRNDEPLAANSSAPRAASGGAPRLADAVSKFLETHTIALDLAENEESEAENAVSARRRNKKKNKHGKGLKYVLMTMLGIFGISGPLILKTLALISGKALIASKVALLIVGSVALKKIFSSHDHEHSSVKVHTIPLHHDHDDLDRNMNFGPYYNYNSKNL